MKKLILILAALVFIFQACQKKSESRLDSNELNSRIGTLFDQYYEDHLKLYPLEATFSGDNRYNDRLPNNITQSYRSALKAFYTEYKNKLLEYDKSELSADNQISYDVLQWECDIHLEALNYPGNLMPINQMNATYDFSTSLHLIMGQLAGGRSAQPFKTVIDYGNWLKRLDAFTVWCDTAIVNMREGMEKGYVLPKALTKKVILQMADLNHGPIQEHLFYSPVKLMPGIFSEEDKSRLKKEYSEMVAKKIIPAFKHLHNFLKDEYLPACRETAGISALPQGTAFYNHKIKYFTTTEMTADEIFELGQREVERIQKELIKIKDRVGFKGDMKEFFDFVRTNKELMPYTKAGQIIEHFKEIHNRMKPNLVKLFDKVPKTAFEIRRTEAFREKSASMEYSAGSLDGTRPGIFYVPVPNAGEYNIYADENAFLHEAIPGHHYQISLQQENTALPKFRRTTGYDAYSEGWALYTESLGKELGLYTDPYQYLGMLSWDMHRAIRLVVDVGMHVKGWTREQAIQYSLNHEPETDDVIISEIERYMANPGQALSYKIGQLKIRELRAKAENTLGEQFDIREFHNQILELGSVPLKILGVKIDEWIEKTGNNSKI